jgi:PAS domain S-box-containing protein
MHNFFLNHQEFADGALKIGVWYYDSLSGKVDWSYGMEVIYGLPRGGFLGTMEDFVRRIHPDDVARNLRESQEAVDSRQPFDLYFRIVRTDGAVRWVNARGLARWNAEGIFLGASGIQMDISEQVEREQQIRLQAQVIANMAEGVVMVHAESGNITYANPRFEQMLGYTSGALVGQHISVVNASSQQDPAKVAGQIISELHRFGYWRGEVNNRCADGREIWTTCTVSELVYEGMSRIWISVHTDISAQREAQQERDEAMIQLRQLALNIQDSIEAERLAVSRDVHDQLGAALTGMRMRLEALAGQLDPESANLAAELRNVTQTARSLQLAARNICTHLRPQILDDVGLVDACRWYVKDWSASTGIPVRSRIVKLKTEPNGKIATDMFRVLQELLTNVARHAVASEVEVSLSGGKSSLNLKVRDNGRGFEPSQSKQGFGLMGVRERVRQHGGLLQLDSGAGGTTACATMRIKPLT